MTDVRQTCCVTGREFLVTEAEQEHIARLNQLMPVLKNALPLPDIHPHEALRRLAAFVNFFHLVRGRSAVSGKSCLTRYHPALGTKVCLPEEFWGDAFDNLQFGRPYDFTRPFFPQWHELLQSCCLIPLIQINCEGSEYVNGGTNLKDCYLCFNSSESQDCLYCLNHFDGSDNVDCVGAMRSRYCYSCVTIENCYECAHCEDCINCSQCFACSDLIGCHECYGCIGLRNARHHLFNEPLTPGEYAAEMKHRTLGHQHSRAEALRECRAFLRSQPHIVNRLINVEDCTGDYLRNSHCAYSCWFSDHLDHCGYILSSPRFNHCWRAFGFGSEYCYESIPVKSCRDLYSYCSVGGEENIYCFHLEQNCARCFGCVGLKRKSYCILNRQYSEGEYLELAPRIIAHMKSTGEWGRFFPPRYSPHIYDHTVVHDYFEAIDPSEAKRRGYRFDELPAEAAAKGGCRAEKLPADIADVTDADVIGRPLLCEETARPYNIQKKELDFYRRYLIPLPRVHWIGRLRRLAQSRKLIPDPS